MKCHYCQHDYPMTQLQFVEDGMVPGIAMVRRRARCSNCRTPPNTIDGLPSEPVIDPTDSYDVTAEADKDHDENYPF